MGEAKRRRATGLSPRSGIHQSTYASGAMTFEEARALTQRDGTNYWAWVPRQLRGVVVGADTYISYRDDEDGDGAARVRIEGDDWDNPETGEEGDELLEDVPTEAREATWYRVLSGDPFELPEFSFLRLRELGCTDLSVLAIAREFDKYEG